MELLLDDRFLRLERSREIKAMRDNGETENAIQLCLSAIKTFPNDSFYFKIITDLYFESQKIDDAFENFLIFMRMSLNSPNSLRDFSRRFFRFKKSTSFEKFQIMAEKIRLSLIGADSNNPFLKNYIAVVDSEISPVKRLVQEFDHVRTFAELLVSSDKKSFERLVLQERLVEQDFTNQVPYILDEYILNRERTDSTFQIDLYCISLYEKFERYDSAIKVAKELIYFRRDAVAIRSLFRICRKIRSYEEVDTILSAYPEILEINEFNVLYELVYYYEARKQELDLNSILRQIDKSFAQNHAVLRTLRNFYIRFGMLEELRRVEVKIQGLIESSKRRTPEKFANEEEESGFELASKVSELYSQLEHQKQLAAISDLTTGISHELGQPITNIRYTIQFYRRVLKRGMTEEEVFRIFDSILQETERMGGLISRLSPLTSSKGIEQEFDIIERIQARLKGETARLTEGKITTEFRTGKVVKYYADPVKFDQLISNLLLNAIDAIREKKNASEKKISIKVFDKRDSIRIVFSDTGVGIPRQNRRKIFDPFFSTKPPGKGEGLGLFIVWNVITMLGGRISVDEKMNAGAAFFVELPRGNK